MKFEKLCNLLLEKVGVGGILPIPRDILKEVIDFVHTTAFSYLLFKLQSVLNELKLAQKKKDRFDPKGKYKPNVKVKKDSDWMSYMLSPGHRETELKDIENVKKKILEFNNGNL